MLVKINLLLHLNLILNELISDYLDRLNTEPKIIITIDNCHDAVNDQLDIHILTINSKFENKIATIVETKLKEQESRLKNDFKILEELRRK